MVSKSKYEIPIRTFNIHVQTRLGKYTLCLLPGTHKHSPCINNNKIANYCSLATVLIVYCLSEKISPLTVKHRALLPQANFIHKAQDHKSQRQTVNIYTFYDTICLFLFI